MNWLELNEQLDAKEIIKAVLKNDTHAVVLQSSFGMHSALMLHLVHQVIDELGMEKIPTIWIDTGYLFKETYEYVDVLKNLFELNLKMYQSEYSPAHMEAKFGKLYETDHFKYGYLRKVEPMERALKDTNARIILTGLRAVQTQHRQGMNIVNRQKDGRFKVCPILSWTDKDVEDYMVKNELPYHPLKYKGYATVGDTHSSRPVSDTDDSIRATRFHGKEQECGLHVDIDPSSMFQENEMENNATKKSDIVSVLGTPGHYVLITKPSCKHCIAAKERLTSLNLPWVELTVGKQITVEQIYPYLPTHLQHVPLRTVPQVFHPDGSYIGGNTQLQATLKS